MTDHAQPDPAWPSGSACYRRRFLPWTDEYTGPLWRYERTTENDPDYYPIHD